MSKYRVRVLLVQVLIMFLLLTFWELGYRLGFINSFIFSSPSKVLNTFIGLCTSGDLLVHVYTTLLEVLVSFILGILIGFIISIIMYLCKFLADVLDLFLTTLNSLPKVALGPIIIIWAGANTSSIIVMTLLINVIISIITMYNAFIHTYELKIKLFKTFKASKYQILTKLVIPANFANIISAFKINISLTLIGVIMEEFLVSKQGIGYLILYGTQVFNLDLVITGIIILIIMSYLIYKIITCIEKRLLT